VCFTGKTNYGFDKWHEKSDDLEGPREAKFWNVVPYIYFDTTSPGSQASQNHPFFFSSWMLLSSSEESERSLFRMLLRVTAPPSNC